MACTRRGNREERARGGRVRGAAGFGGTKRLWIPVGVGEADLGPEVACPVCGCPLEVMERDRSRSVFRRRRLSAVPRRPL